MAKYKVAFNVNGTVYKINCQMTKIGNQYLQCFADTANNDSAKVAFIPFDSVAYIVHENTTVTTESVDDTGSAQSDTDDATVLGGPVES